MSKLRNPIEFRSTFSEYQATEILGEGGSGIVYGAMESGSEAPVAIKLLDPSKATRDKLKRFENEYRFCSSVRHPNVIRVLDHGLSNGLETPSPFFVMPRYETSLRPLLDSIDLADLLQRFSEILNGVEAAHLQGVVHRDLKPENILVASDGTLVVTDFGIARFRQEDLYTLVETRSNKRLANFQYAAPEQRARGREVGKEADIYALGLILTEMATGEVPLGSGYRSIGSVTQELAYLDPIVDRMIRQSPADRYHSIDEIKRELIGRRNEFITRQRISQLKQQVVPTSELEDPLIANPPKIKNVDWVGNHLTIELEPEINPAWISALKHMGNYSSVYGKGPDAFKWKGSTAHITAQEDEVQRILNHFKQWLPKATKKYEATLRAEQLQREQRERERLEREVAMAEARERVLNNLEF